MSIIFSPILFSLYIDTSLVFYLYINLLLLTNTYGSDKTFSFQIASCCYVITRYWQSLATVPSWPGIKKLNGKKVGVEFWPVCLLDSQRLGPHLYIAYFSIQEIYYGMFCVVSSPKVHLKHLYVSSRLKAYSSFSDSFSCTVHINSTFKSLLFALLGLFVRPYLCSDIAKMQMLA